MSEAYQRKQLVSEGSRSLNLVSAGIVAVGIATFVLSWTTLFKITSIKMSVLGYPLHNLYGVLTLVLGVSVTGCGVASRVGLVETQPSDTAGMVSGVAFGLIAFSGIGLYASQALGFGVLGWLPVAVGGGVGMFGVTVLPREDIGSTLPSGVVALVVGGAFVTGAVGPGWRWSPEKIAADFMAPVVVPLLTALTVFLCAWSAAKAYEGFGARGRQKGAYMIILMTVGAMLSVLGLLIFYVMKEGAGPALRGFEIGLDGVKWPFVTNGYTLRPEVPDGVFPAIMGTVWLVVGSVLFAVPLGVGAAVFLTEYAEGGRFTRAVEVATNSLWSTPSIVFGLFGYAFIVPRSDNRSSVLAGMLVLGFMLLPLVLITSREAIKSVPDSYRDASAALGVSKWETVRSVVIPAAMPGVVTGVILGVGRIAGETAPLILVMAGGLRAPAPNVLGGFRFISSPPFVVNDNLLQPAQALPYKLYAIITAGVSAPEWFGWATAFVLLLVVLSFYAVGIFSRRYFRRKLHNE